MSQKSPQKQNPKSKTKTLDELRNHLKELIKPNENGGGFINPYEELEPNESATIHPYKSQAVDAAVKFMMAKTTGQERRRKILGVEWEIIR